MTVWTELAFQGAVSPTNPATSAAVLVASGAGIDPTGVSDSYFALQQIGNLAITAGKALYIPWGTYLLSAGLNFASNQFRVFGAGSGDTTLLASADGYDVLIIGPGTSPAVRPNGIASGMSIYGRARATDGKSCVKINGGIQFQGVDLELLNKDIGADFVNDSYGSIFTNCRIGFGGNLNVGVNLRQGSDSGSDLTFINTWCNGRIAGLSCSGQGGGYHIFGGQIGAGQGTVSTNDLAGAVILGKDYLTGATGETSIDFHGTSFEGTDFAYIFRAFDQCFLATYGISVNPASNTQPAIGFYKGDNSKNSRIRLDGTIISGWWSGELLAVINGNYGGLFWWEFGTYCAANNPTINGVQGYVTSIAAQAGIMANAVVIDNAGVYAGGVLLSTAGSGSVQVVNYGTTLSTPRPVGAASVYWIGTGTPVNAINTDIIYDGTSSSIISPELSPLAPALATAESFPRTEVTASSAGALSTGRISIQAILLQAGMVITSATFFSTATAAGTPTHQWVALFDSSFNLLQLGTDETTRAWAANNSAVFPLAATYTVPTTGIYYIGLVIVATTVPSLAGSANMIILAGTYGSSANPIICVVGNSGLTNPASCPSTLTTGGTAASAMYVYTS